LLPILKADLYALLVPDEKGLFYARICHACEKEKIRGVAVEHGKGLLGEALKDNRILFTENLASDPRCQEAIYKSLPAKTLMVAPLHAKGKTMGMLMIGTQAQHRYSEEREVSLLATIADQLAVAMENIGVYEKEKEAVARLTELDRLKNEFISMVSHELRTPVTSADGYVSLFLSGVTGPVTEDQKKFLTIVKENNQRLLTLINRLLDFSRIETGRFTIKRELISINQIIHAVEQIVKPQLEKKEAALKLQLEAKNVNFMGDREKMEEVFFNLIENALKFSKDDGKPVIEIRTRDVENIIEVTVADNGIGIGKEYLYKIFNKFYQVEDTMTRKVGGVGLGLAIVKEIIGNHHGKIWAESEGKGAGARFIFTLPLAEKI
jgi:signal transduction histidine kinase